MEDVLRNVRFCKNQLDGEAVVEIDRPTTTSRDDLDAIYKACQKISEQLPKHFKEEYDKGEVRTIDHGKKRTIAFRFEVKNNL